MLLKSHSTYLSLVSFVSFKYHLKHRINSDESIRTFIRNISCVAWKWFINPYPFHLNMYYFCFYSLVPATNNAVSGTLRIINRRTWLAQPAVRPSNPLQHPVPYVVILHTATDNCSTQAECVFIVRHIQTFHIESNGWNDIGYSFLVGGDGNVYEGRGWDTEGAFAYGYNSRAIGIAFIGTFTVDVPEPKQILAGKQLMELGVTMGKISPHYKLLAHRQVSPTESPGLAFYEFLKTWPHWAEHP